MVPNLMAEIDEAFALARRPAIGPDLSMALAAFGPKFFGDAVGAPRPGTPFREIHAALASGVHQEKTLAPLDMPIPANIQAEYEKAKATLDRERSYRIDRELDDLLTRGQIQQYEVPAAHARALADETYLAELKLRPSACNSFTGSAGTIFVGAENPLEKVYAERDPIKRHSIMASDWDAMIADAQARDGRGEKCRVTSPHAKNRLSHLPVAANTYSATLVTSFLLDGSVTILQKKLAALGAYTKNFSADRYKPLATGQLKKVTVGATTQTDATNFETSGDSTVAPVSPTIHQYTQGFQVSNADLQSGLRMQDLVDINAAVFGNKLTQVATAPITEANFANYNSGSYVSAPAAFGWGDMALIWGVLKNALIKNAILDGEYLGMLNNTPGFFQAAPVGGGAATNFGWDGLYLNTEWTGAGTGCRGFFCDPQAIGAVTGLPVSPASVGAPSASILQENTIQLPGLGITVANYAWFSTASRTFWTSYDLMLGAAALDTTAGIFLKAS